MTRIVAGDLGGRVLAVPPRGTRPTGERVREALFSRLEHRGAVDGARVLDLYAGSGALGLEAASRGAAAVVLVESDRDAAGVCRANVRDLGLTATVTVVADRVERYLAGPAAPVDLLLADPPYAVDDEALADVLDAAAALCVPGASVVVERSARGREPTWPSAWQPDGDRRYGETRLWFASVPG